MKLGGLGETPDKEMPTGREAEGTVEGGAYGRKLEAVKPDTLY